MVVDAGVDQHAGHLTSPHPAQGILDEESTESPAAGGGVDREALDVAQVTGPAADDERHHVAVAVVADATRPVLRGRRDDVGECGGVVRPRRCEGPPVDRCRLVQHGRPQPPHTVGGARRSGCVRGPPTEIEFVEGERVDRPEACTDECGHGRREQGAGADRASATRSGLGHPCVDVGGVGHHVMVEQDEVDHLVVVGPPPEPGPDPSVDRRTVHRLERSRPRVHLVLTTASAS